MNEITAQILRIITEKVVAASIDLGNGRLGCTGIYCPSPLAGLASMELLSVGLRTDGIRCKLLILSMGA
jgi:hypothetical protein